MSFSSEIKNELCSLDNISACCYHAQVYGLVLFAHFNSFNFSITTENKSVYDMYCSCMRDYVKCDYTENTSGIRKMSVYIDDKDSQNKVFNKFGHSSDESSLRINYANFTDECCISSFLRGVFLSCGSVSDPNKMYHLEFVVPFKKLSADLISIMGELNLSPKYVNRKGNHVVYFKDSESIEDFLAYIGAQNASLYVMNIKIEKDVKNRINRQVNNDIYNIEKTLSASRKQIEAIEFIKGNAGLAVLNEGQRKLAQLRLDNPEASLTELYELYDEDISRSGIKHRLDRIVEIAEKMKLNNR